MRNFRIARVLLILALLLGAKDAAQALCPLPYTLANGQTADATQVMADFAAVVTCLSNVGPGGSTNAVQINGGSGAFVGIGPLTNGQLVIGSTGAAPQAQTLTPGAGIQIANGPGSITITATGTGGAGSGLYNQVMSATPTSAMTGLTNWLNQGGAVVSDSAVGLCINAPASSSDNITGRYMAAPSPPYTMTALVAATRNSSGYNSVGIGWYDGSSKLHLLSYLLQNGGAPYFHVEEWNSVTSFNYNDIQSSSNAFSQPIWLQIRDDGTNVYFDFSQDGANFLQLFMTSKASGFLGSAGYANIVFFVNPRASQTFGTLMSWKQS